MSGKLAALHSVCAKDRVRYVRKEIAADRKKHFDVSVKHSVQSLDGVIPALPGWFKVELFPKGIQKRFWRALPHTHCAVTLDIRVPTHTYGACPGAPYMPANEQKIHDHRNIVDAVAMLCNACAPGAYGLL